MNRIITMLEKYRAIRPVLETLFGIDARALAFARVCAGVITLLDLFERAKDIPAFFLTSGVAPHPGFLGYTEWRWSLHTLIDTSEWVLLLFAIQAIVALLLIVGYRTRFITFVALLLTISLQHANVLVQNGGDTVFRLLLFFAVFVPWGDAYSLDAARRKGMAVRTRVFSPWSAALLIQIGLVYLVAGLHKTGLVWSEGTAVAYVTQSASYARPFGRWIGTFPDSLLTFLTYSIVYFQRMAMVLLFVPFYNAWFRIPTVAVLMLMHIAFGVALYLGWFPLVEVAVLALFLPSRFWDWLESFFTQSFFERLVLPSSPVRGIRALGERIYRMTARPAYEAYSARTPAPWVSILSVFGAAAAIVIATLLHVDNLAVTRASLSAKYFRHDPWLEATATLIGLDQRLNFFAPNVARYDEWPLARVMWSDGREEDPLRNWSRVDWERPSSTRDIYHSRRWTSYINQVKNFREPMVLENLARYFCSLAKERSVDEARPVRVELYLMRGRELLTRESPTPRPIQLTERACD